MSYSYIFPKIAKCSLVIMWGIFVLPLVMLIVFYDADFLAPFNIILEPLFLMVLLPCYVTVDYFHDPAKIASKYCLITLSDDVRRRIAPLEVYLDESILLGYYWSSEKNTFSISSIFGNKTIIAFSSGLLEVADNQQLLSLAAHEIAHVKNGDAKNKASILAFIRALQFYPVLFLILSEALLKAVALLFIGIVVFLFFNSCHSEECWKLGLGGSTLEQWLVLIVSSIVIIFFSVILNNFVEKKYMTYSREREFAADKEGAGMTSTRQMISALSLLEQSKINNISIFDALPLLEERERKLWGLE